MARVCASADVARCTAQLIGPRVVDESSRGEFFSPPLQKGCLSCGISWCHLLSCCHLSRQCLPSDQYPPRFPSCFPLCHPSPPPPPPSPFQSARWVRATALMCSHFARQGPILAFSSPSVPLLSAPLSQLSEAVSDCEAATLPTFRPPSYGPQGAILTIIPPYISGVIAAVYLRAHNDPSSAPEWLTASVSARDLPQVSANEFGHFALMHLMALSPGDSDPDFSNVISTNLSRTLGVPLGSVEGEVQRRLAPGSSQQKVVFGFLDMPPESMKVLQLALGFLLPAEVVEAVERGMSEAWQSMSSLAGIMNMELRQMMGEHSALDMKLMTSAERWLEKELQSVKDLDI